MSWTRPLSRALQPVVKFNSAFYAKFNEASSRALDKHGHRIPSFVTANSITTGRLGLLPPTLLLWSADYTVLPASLVMANLLLDYADGAVARWEQRVGRSQEKELQLAKTADSYYDYMLKLRWGAYWDAVADKCFAIPVWSAGIVMLSDSPLLQSALMCHLMAEGISVYVRTREYFKEALVPPQRAQGESTVVASAVGKSKQFLAMTGTTLAMIPLTQPVGTALLSISIPLAALSLYQKLGPDRAAASEASRTVFAQVGSELTSADLDFLWRARTLGHSLVVGAPATAYGVQRALRRMAPLVDRVVEESTPESSVNVSYLQAHGADIVVVRSEEALSRVDATLLQRNLVEVAPSA